MRVHADPGIAPRSTRGPALAVGASAVHRILRRPYSPAERSALLDATRKLGEEEMAELQLELGYLGRALRIYEGLLLGEPSNPSFRARCEWLARLVLAEQPTVRQQAPPRRPPARSGITARWPQAVSDVADAAAVRPLEIITVGR